MIVCIAEKPSVAREQAEKELGRSIVTPDKLGEKGNDLQQFPFEGNDE